MSFRPQAIVTVIPTFANGLAAPTPANGSAPNLARGLQMAIVPVISGRNAKLPDLSGKRRTSMVNTALASVASNFALGPHGVCGAVGGSASRRDLTRIPTMNAAAIPWTMSFICKMRTTAAAERGLVTTEFARFYHDTNRSGFFVDRDGTTTNGATASPTVDMTLWHHFVATFSGSGTTPQIWVDGVRGEGSLSSAGSTTDSSQWWIGRSPTNGDSDMVWHGLWIWNRKLGNAEIQQHFADPYAMHRLPMPLADRFAPVAVAAASAYRGLLLTGVGG